MSSSSESFVVIEDKLFRKFVKKVYDMNEALGVIIRILNNN